MVQLIKVLDGYVAIKDDITNLEMLQRLFANEKLETAISKGVVDRQATQIINAELNIYSSPMNNLSRYENQLTDNSILIAAKKEMETALGAKKVKDFVICYPDYQVSDEEIPDFVKQAGVKIVRNINKKILQVDEQDNLYWYDFATGKNITETSFTMAGMKEDMSEIIMNDDVFVLSKKDYEICMNANKKNISNLSPGYRRMVYFFHEYISNAALMKKASFAHELHHVMSGILLDARSADDSTPSLSVSDKYKQCEDSEKAAFVAEYLKVIEEYHKRDNYEDLTIFPIRYAPLRALLVNTPVHERKDIVMDMNFMINKAIFDWDNNKANSCYKIVGEQFDRITRKHAEKASVLKMENNSREYMIQRNLMYSFNVYNPYTKKHEMKALGSLVKIDTTIPKEIQEIVINKYDLIVKSRQLKLSRLGVDKEYIRKLRRPFEKHVDSGFSKTAMQFSKVQRESLI